MDKYIAQSFLKYNNDMTWGITARKQAGEAFCWDHDTHRYGFNLWSVFVQLDGQKYFKRMVIGDYQVGYGQGLLLSSGYFLPKGSDVHTIICSHNTGIRPYKGIRRVGLRGLAITSVLGGIELTAFYATNNLDAKIAIGEDGQPYTRHIDPTGKYDTNNNLKKKGTVHEQVVGTTILRKSNRNQTELGINIMYNYYDVPILTEENYAVPYLLQGQCALATSLFYRFLWKNIILFGEYGINFSDPATKNKQGKHAVIQGILISLSRYVDFSSSIYYYGTGFYSPYGGSVHATDNANKKGLNAIVKLTPCPSWQIVADWHTFAVLHPKTRSSIVGSGNHFTTRSCYVFNRKTLFTIQQRFKEGPKANSKFKQNKTIQDNKDKAIKNSIKCKVDHQITPAWRTNIEAQYVYHAYSNQTYHGYAASSRQKWKVKKWQLSWKITGFKAEDYTTRLYFHEPGPLYGGTRFTPYYGNGIATSFLVCWKPISWFHLALKYGLVYAVSDLHQIAKPKSTRSSLSTQNKQNGLIQVIVRL
ncbi:hypothetical protein [Cardinium endosymbiont of Culicoides punctatus]|uniref:hypothetical protein n=1 Tax=Cardinium endosymbiont of Culicoides punctatus TaxID=2304601 RepID=UPI001058F000|nr:hypothetical protein [Cardinium endosymbiont of Culicoides punctatus]